MLTLRSATATAIILVAAGIRLLPHAPNFTPLIAIGLFGGACFADKRMAFAVPLAAMLMSDLVLGILRYGAETFSSVMFVYSSFVLTVCLGLLLRRRRSAIWIAACVVASSLIFFIIANFGVWLRGHLYPTNLQGLASCYVAALPFLKNAFLSTGLYSAVLFGGFAFAEQRIPVLQEGAGRDPANTGA